MIDVAARKLARAQEQVRLLESLIENQTRELYLQTLALKASRDTLEKLFDAVPGAVLVLDEQLHVVRFNRAALRILEAAPLALEGVAAPRFFPTVAEHLERADAQKEPVVLEAEWQLDGPAVPVLVTISDFEDDGARRHVLIATDLRERKALELELRHAQKLEAIGSLAAGIAHEVNSPLQYLSDNADFVREALVGFEAFMQRLEREAPDTYREAMTWEEATDFPFYREEVPRALDATRDGLKRVYTIVSALKAFSMPGGSKTSCRLRAIIERAITVGQHELRDVAIELEVPPELEVPAFETDLNQILLNLLVNAGHAISDHRRDGRGRIRLWATVDANAVVLHLADNGGGIAEAIQARVFDPFFTTKDVSRGTGQGLSISRKLVVERHQGRLWFDTVPGEGTTFHVSLPRSTARAGVPSVREQKTGT